MVLLVRAKDDMLGLQKLQMLKNHFNCNHVQALHHSTVWCISGENYVPEEIINSNILMNPYAYDLYDY